MHRTVVHPDEIVTTTDGLRLTTAVRTAREVATPETVPAAVAMLDGMVWAGTLDLAALRAAQVAAHGRWRTTRVATVLPLVDGRSESPPESWVRVACVRAGLPRPVPQFAVVDGEHVLGRADPAWPEHRLVVEYEGAYHFTGLQIRRDDRRYERMVAAGWRVIRLSASDLRDMDAVVRRIRAALAASA